MKKLLLIPVSLLFLTLPLTAQERPIDEMFRVMSMEKQMAGGFEAMLPMIDGMANRFQLDKNAKAELKEIFRAWFNEDIDRQKILELVKAKYQQTFSDSEIKEIIRFYKTPVGKKLLEVSSEFAQIGAQAGMAEAQNKQAKLMERIAPFMEKHGIK